jgi:hypothetical protein
MLLLFFSAFIKGTFVPLIFLILKEQSNKMIINLTNIER